MLSPEWWCANLANGVWAQLLKRQGMCEIPDRVAAALRGDDDVVLTREEYVYYSALYTDERNYHTLRLHGAHIPLHPDELPLYGPRTRETAHIPYRPVPEAASTPDKNTADIDYAHYIRRSFRDLQRWLKHRSYDQYLSERRVGQPGEAGPM